MHVAVGFMPAFKYRQKNSLIVLERGHKAHGYVAAGDASKVPIGCPQMTTRLSATADRRYTRKAPMDGIEFVQRISDSGH